MVGLLIVVDILCIDEKFLMKRLASMGQTRMEHAKTGNAVHPPRASKVLIMKEIARTGNAVKLPQTVLLESMIIKETAWRIGNAVKPASKERMGSVKLTLLPGNAVKPATEERMGCVLLTLLPGNAVKPATEERMGSVKLSLLPGNAVKPATEERMGS